jgi:hypothetical protein
MEKKVASAGGYAGHGARTIGTSAALVLATVAGCPAAWANDTGEQAAEATVIAQARTDQRPMRLELQTRDLPRLDPQDTGFLAPRVDLSLFPGRSSRFGAVLGLSGFSPRQPNGLGLAPQAPSFDLGVRWTHKQIDVTAWRRVNAADDAYSQIMLRQPVYGARVEMNITPAKPNLFGLDKGFLGMQLESGARISVKRKNGGPMLYYRQTF